MKRQSKDSLPERVPFSAIPTGETPDIRRWAQPVVWTDRMLTTLLSNKVKGGKWHALIDKVYAPLNLDTAARKVTGKRKAAGVDGQSCEEFEEHLRVETRQLSEELKAQTYRPSAVLRRPTLRIGARIPKPGRPNETRPLGIPTVRDRVVQRAMLDVIEPILDHQFHERSFGFRHGRGAHDALRIVEQKLQEGYVDVVDADLKGFPIRLNASCVEAQSSLFRAVARTTRPRRFDTIPKDRLLALVKEHISDLRMLKLLKLFLDQNILEELHEWSPIAGVRAPTARLVRGSSFTRVVESVPQPAGSSDGRRRFRDGALRRRLRRAVPQPVESGGSFGDDQRVGRDCWSDSASDEDEDRR